MKPFEQMTTDEISNELVKKEQELRLANEKLSVMEDEDNRLNKEKVRIANELSNLRIQILDNEKTLKKAQHNVKQIHSEKRELERLYWQKRNG